jgi:hypothetical protein
VDENSSQITLLPSLFSFQVFGPELSDPSGKGFDFGTMGVGEKREMRFALRNDNPIEIRIRGWGSNMSRSYVELLGSQRTRALELHSLNDLPLLPKTVQTPFKQTISRFFITAVLQVIEPSGSFLLVFLTVDHQTVPLHFVSGRDPLCAGTRGAVQRSRFHSHSVPRSYRSFSVANRQRISLNTWRGQGHSAWRFFSRKFEDIHVIV